MGLAPKADSIRAAYWWESPPSHLIFSSERLSINDEMRRYIGRADELLKNTRMFRYAGRQEIEGGFVIAHYITVNQPGMVILQTCNHITKNQSVYLNSQRIILHAISRKGLESIAKSLQLPKPQITN